MPSDRPRYYFRDPPADAPPPKRKRGESKLSPDERSARARKAAQARMAKLSPEERREATRKATDARMNNLTPQERSAQSRKAAYARASSLTGKQRTKIAIDAAEVRRRNWFEDGMWKDRLKRDERRCQDRM